MSNVLIFIDKRTNIYISFRIWQMLFSSANFKDTFTNRRWGWKGRENIFHFPKRESEKVILTRDIWKACNIVACSRLTEWLFITYSRNFSTMSLTSPCIRKNVSTSLENKMDKTIIKEMKQWQLSSHKIIIRRMSFIQRIVEFGKVFLSVASEEDGDYSAHHPTFFACQIQS